MLAGAIAELERSADATWGVSVSLDGGEPLDGSRAADELRTASVGKLLLLVAAARELEAGRMAEDTPIERAPEDAVADSGLWQHLRQPELGLGDACVLIGTVSDNLATNALLRVIGLDRVDAVGRELGLADTALRDRVRDERGPGDPPALSTGSAAELRGLFERLMRDELLGPAVAGRVRGWLANGVDLSMVASAFNLDPLSHQVPDRGFTVINKTGTNADVRADVGWVRGPAGSAVYAVIANWRDSDPRDAVIAGMRSFGAALRDALAISRASA